MIRRSATLLLVVSFDGINFRPVPSWMRCARKILISIDEAHTKNGGAHCAKVVEDEQACLLNAW